MELKVKLLKWSAGIPVAMLNPKTASKLGIHLKDRISIKPLSNHREISTIVDIIENLVKDDEIVISSEIKKIMDLNNGQKVIVNLSESPDSLNFIKNKLNGKKLSSNEISQIIKDIVSNSLSEPEIALFVSAMYDHGMSMDETVFLVRAILKSGSQLKFNNKYVADKHSIGGIAGNRTTPIVVSICASVGIIMPKSSSRAITSSAGTADVIETIARVDFSVKEIKKIIKKTNACIVWGGSLGLAPADDKIIQIEKMISLDPEAQLLASIMAKKISMGAKYILIDIPFGKTAKVNEKRAKRLKKKFEELGKIFKKKLKVVMAEVKGPLGEGVGPALELIDVIKVLDQKQKGPKRLEEKSLILSGEILEMTGKAKKGKGFSMAKEILSSGKAFEKFKQIIKAQQGSLKKIKLGKFKKEIFSKHSGKISDIDNNQINLLARMAGCPVDKFAGVKIHFSVGDTIKSGDNVLTIYTESKPRLDEALNFYKTSKIFHLI